MFAVSRTNIIRQLRTLQKLFGPLSQLSSQHEMTPTKHRTTRGAELRTSESQDTLVKPPNVIIHHGSGAGGQARLRQLVMSVVSGEHYTVYDLPVAAPPVWLESAALLVLAGRLTGTVTAVAERFWRSGGAVLSLSSSLTLGRLAAEPQPVAERDLLLSHGDAMDVPCRYSADVRPLSAAAAAADRFQDRSTGRTSDVTTDREIPDVATDRTCDVTVPITARRRESRDLETDPSPLPPPAVRCSPAGGSGRALLCQLDWDVSAPAQLSLLRSLLHSQLGVRCTAATEKEVLYQPGYLLSDAATAALLTADRSARHSPTLRVVTAAAGAAVTASADLLPLRVGPPPAAQFDWSLFRAELDTAELGRCLVYLPAVTSSMDVLREPLLPHGAVVICDRQTRGRGRAGNAWISPAGCCMLSVRLLVSLDSPLGGRLSWLQHAAALAVVEAVDDPRLGLKWPNDLYWAGRTKVGGVLVETDVTGRRAECRLGIGVNLDNAAPTVCLNRLLTASVARERLTARLLSQLERLLRLETSELSDRYRRRWLHERQQVTVKRDGTEVAAEVSGLDPHGFLLVQAASDGASLAVSPDGNSFDMMRGLIVPKQAV